MVELSDSTGAGKGKGKANEGTSEQNQTENAKGSNATGKGKAKAEQNAPEASKKPAGPSKADMKKQQKAEKQARRAAAKAGGAESAESSTAGQESPSVNGVGNQSGPSRAQPQQSQRQSGNQRRQSSSSGAQQQQQSRQLPIRDGAQTQASRARRASQSRPATTTSTNQLDKRVPLFAHLYDANPRQAGLTHRSVREIHPAFQKLALDIANYSICGSHARCVALLLALKAVIRDYTTPPGTSLPRHLPSAYFSPLLSHLKSHSRPLSISQANSVRWLKTHISTMDPGMTEETAKSELCASIDNYIRERFTVADEVIATTACQEYIPSHEDGEDEVLVFGNSAVVRRTLQLAAIKHKKRFSVTVVDSRPLNEGRALTRSLLSLSRDANSTIKSLNYTHISALSHAVTHRTTLCLLGAHGVLADGSVVARAGSAMCALMAKDLTDNRCKVVVCAEGVKFTERVTLDGGVGLNELAPEHEMLPPLPHLEGSKKGDQDQSGDQQMLEHWRQDERFKLLNPMHDVTPASLVDSLVTEYGVIPATAASGIIWRLASGGGMDSGELGGAE